MEMPSMDQIKNMTSDELAVVNRELGKRVLKRMLLVHGIKWAAIIGLTVGVQKLVESRLDDKTETNE